MMAVKNTEEVDEPGNEQNPAALQQFQHHLASLLDVFNGLPLPHKKQAWALLNNHVQSLYVTTNEEKTGTTNESCSTENYEGDINDTSADCDVLPEDDFHKKKWECVLCGIEFCQKLNYEKHLAGHERNKCQLCGEGFARRRLYIKHAKEVHNVHEAEKYYTCQYCAQKFVKRITMFAHYNKHALEKGLVACRRCGEFFENPAALEDHMEKHEYVWKCEICHETFTRKPHYQLHLRGHDRYLCSCCTDTFASKHKLEQHSLSVHKIPLPPEKKYQCNTCGKCFSRRRLLQYHSHVHSGERPYSCTICQKTFRTKKAYVCHTKTDKHQANTLGDTRPREFSCEFCFKKFKKKSVCSRHVCTHNPEKLYTCTLCDFSTNTQCNLVRHKKLHTEEKRFVCELCGASFHAKSTLQDHHTYVHSDVRDFTCEICSASFKNKSGLTRHLQTHNDARPHACFCGQAYKRASHLTRHMSKHHHNEVKSRHVQRLQPNEDGVLIPVIKNKQVKISSKPPEQIPEDPMFNVNIALDMEPRDTDIDANYSDLAHVSDDNLGLSYTLPDVVLDRNSGVLPSMATLRPSLSETMLNSILANPSSESLVIDVPVDSSIQTVEQYTLPPFSHLTTPTGSESMAPDVTTVVTDCLSSNMPLYLN